MTENHIAVKIDGVVYVKLNDVKPMRFRIEKLEAALQEIVEQEPQTAHPVVVHIIAISRKALEGKDG